MLFFGVFPHRPFLRALSILHLSIGTLTIILIIIMIVQLAPGDRLEGTFPVPDFHLYAVGLNTVLFIELLVIRGFSSYTFPLVSHLTDNPISGDVGRPAHTEDVTAKAFEVLIFMENLKVFLFAHIFAVLTLMYAAVLSQLNDPETLRKAILFHIPYVFVFEMIGFMTCFPSLRRQREYEQFINGS